MLEKTDSLYPIFSNTDSGIKVAMSKGANLPGHFTNQLAAERAVVKSLAKSRKNSSKKG